MLNASLEIQHHRPDLPNWHASNESFNSRVTTRVCTGRASENGKKDIQL